ncbi:hypothetical protein LshimejAT787_0308010 [Lyophyllum shimeji]|uniref:Uncharacterized protein n=1 Tax=Lyophyllum shimeji TaxID=47721 RepID=A0A9P3PJC3_LYOSH|nr:hypothetical protein LshimejAT787_0308010 [Lyophyllum shimeji]
MRSSPIVELQGNGHRHIHTKHGQRALISRAQGAGHDTKRQRSEHVLIAKDKHPLYVPAQSCNDSPNSESLISEGIRAGALHP